MCPLCNDNHPNAPQVPGSDVFVYPGSGDTADTGELRRKRAAARAAKAAKERAAAGSGGGGGDGGGDGAASAGGAAAGADGAAAEGGGVKAEAANGAAAGVKAEDGAEAEPAPSASCDSDVVSFSWRAEACKP
jgi:hypothetical protein